MNITDFKVGQTVYLKTITHLYNCWKNEIIFEAVVSKVGRKYITVKKDSLEYQFIIDEDFRQKTVYSIEFELFLSERDIRDYWQSAYLRHEISNVLAKNGKELPLRSLMAAATALHIPIFYEDGGASNG